MADTLYQPLGSPAAIYPLPSSKFNSTTSFNMHINNKPAQYLSKHSIFISQNVYAKFHENVKQQIKKAGAKFEHNYDKTKTTIVIVNDISEKNYETASNNDKVTASVAWLYKTCFREKYFDPCMTFVDYPSPRGGVPGSFNKCNRFMTVQHMTAWVIQGYWIPRFLQLSISAPKLLELPLLQKAGDHLIPEMLCVKLIRDNKSTLRNLTIKSRPVFHTCYDPYIIFSSLSKCTLMESLSLKNVRLSWEKYNHQIGLSSTHRGSLDLFLSLTYLDIRYILSPQVRFTSCASDLDPIQEILRNCPRLKTFVTDGWNFPYGRIMAILQGYPSTLQSFIMEHAHSTNNRAILPPPGTTSSSIEEREQREQMEALYITGSDIVTALEHIGSSGQLNTLELRVCQKTYRCKFPRRYILTPPLVYENAISQYCQSARILIWHLLITGDTMDVFTASPNIQHLELICRKMIPSPNLKITDWAFFFYKMRERSLQILKIQGYKGATGKSTLHEIVEVATLEPLYLVNVHNRCFLTKALKELKKTQPSRHIRVMYNNEEIVVKDDEE
ncbi:hypothetical protein BDA99DRAFT_540160 [Phascolomyces articulosus]|uniref:BRCT domain-containing protein n=1 Tax=Phascolomyces articulosus TaxID=60185 RepID=A0AAD5K853_9FUNG|nr:hypothetical protein BDA99DRAFT_540160 [Phascolomyces articulosus]